MFKKKCLFGGGGLCLGSAIAIFASISSDVIAMEAVKAKNSIHDFRSELNQIAWNCDCSFEEWLIGYNLQRGGGKVQDLLKADKEDQGDVWILDKKYKDSRTKVIGKAIGDCVAGEGAFANKTPEGIITFEKTDPKTYKQRNWNAVILYNYIHEAINGEAFKEFFPGDKTAVESAKKDYAEQLSDVEDVLKNKLEKLNEHYKAECSEKCIKRLAKAVEHIQKYVETLRLYEYLYDFRTSKQEYDKVSEKEKALLSLAPDLSKVDDEEVGLGYAFHCADPEGDADKRQLFSPSFRYQDGKLCIARLVAWQETRKKAKGDIYNWVGYRAYYVPTVDEFKKDKGKWIMERLEGLVNEPSEDLWNKWNPKNK